MPQRLVEVTLPVSEERPEGGKHPYIRSLLSDPEYRLLRERWYAMMQQAERALLGAVEEDLNDRERLLLLIEAQGRSRRLIDDGMKLFVPLAKKAGATWQEIGDALGVERQVVWRKYRDRT